MKGNSILAILVALALLGTIAWPQPASAQTALPSQPADKGGVVRAEGSSDDGMGGGGPIWLEFDTAGGPVKGRLAYKGPVECQESPQAPAVKGTMTADVEIAGTLTGNAIQAEGRVRSYTIDNPTCAKIAAGNEMGSLSITATVDFAAGIVKGKGTGEGVLSFSVAFLPAALPVVVKDGWQAVAADGQSELQIEVTLPQGSKIEVVEFKIAKVTQAKEESGGWGSLLSFGGSKEEPKGEEPKDAKPVAKKVENGKAVVAYRPPKVISRPFEVEVAATATDAAGRVATGSAKFWVVLPPVVLVHGIWSSAEDGWGGSLAGLRQAGFDCTVRFDYGERNNGDPVEIAKSLATWIEGANGPLKAAAAGKCGEKGLKTLASRYDIVAHSLGGLITRRMIADGKYQGIRRVITLGTPHQGSEFADWFVYFQRGKTDKSIPVPAVVAEHPGFKADPNWDPKSFDPKLKNFVRKPLLLNDRYFSDGKAVDALRPGSDFLKALNADGASAHADQIEYYLIAGTTPFFSEGVKKTFQDGAQRMADPAQNKDFAPELRLTPTEVYVFQTFYEYVGMPGTDGVVSVASALGQGLPFKPVAVDRVATHHIGLTKAAIPVVANYLKNGTGAGGSSGGGGSVAYTSGTLMSPAHLHAYDEQGRHVGLTADGRVEIGIPGATFLGPEETTGLPETIYVPGDAPVRFEVQGYKEGKFGLVVRRQTAMDNSEVRFNEVPIKPGEKAVLGLEGDRYAQLQTPAGKVSPAAVVELPKPAGAGGTASAVRGGGGADLSWLWLGAGLVVGGGATLVAVRRRRGPAPLPTAAGGSAPAPTAGGHPAATGSLLVAPAPSPVGANPQGEVEARFCHRCGKPLLADARFCAACGTAAAGAVGAAPVAAGWPTPGQVAASAGAAQFAQSGRQERPKGRHNGLFFGLGSLSALASPLIPVLGLLALGCAVALWMGGARKRAAAVVLCAVVGMMVLAVLVELVG